MTQSSKPRSADGRENRTKFEQRCEALAGLRAVALVRASRGFVVMCGYLTMAMVTAGCSGTRASFRPTDPSFVPSPLQGASLRVYFFKEEVPNVPMRSVGIVEVSVPGGDREERRITDAAAAKGKELGCWALIRHSVYSEMQKHASAWFGRHSGVMLVHGSGGGGGGGSGSYGHYEPERERKESFDCVVRRDGAASM